MYEWRDPDTNERYEIMYNVTQSEDEGPEHFLWRKLEERATCTYVPEWTQLPPFVSHQDMRKIEDEVFGPTQGWQHGIPASIVSDIERIDAAIDNLIDADEEVLNRELIADALHDARSGLLYLAGKLKSE